MFATGSTYKPPELAGPTGMWRALHALEMRQYMSSSTPAKVGGPPGTPVMLGAHPSANSLLRPSLSAMVVTSAGRCQHTSSDATTS